MGKPDHGGRCWRHPKHRQSIGVCPFCLRERLSHLSHNHSSDSSSGSSSPYSTDSDVSSSPTSPPHAHHHDVKGARISFLLRREHALTKSQSMAFVSGGARTEEEEGKGKEKKKKKKKFWAKLLMGGSERKQKMTGANLMHSHTFKEQPSAKWALFA